MSEPKVVDINGTIEEKEQKEDKNNNKYAKLKINGTSWNWHYSRDNKKDEIQVFLDNLHKGDNIKGLGEETEGEWDGAPCTYHNVKSLEKVETKEENVVSEDTEETPKGQPEQKHMLEEEPYKTQKLVKVITADAVKDFEEQINQFNKEHRVFATQTSFQMIEGLQKFMAVLYYEE